MTKGYTVFEVLLLVLFLCTVTLLTLSNAKEVDMSHYYFINDYLYKQTVSLKENRNVQVNDDIHFNGMGRVNRAKTIHFNRHSVIIHLGNGYISYEQ